MPITYPEYETLEIVQQILYKNELSGYDAAVKLVGEKVAVALLISVLKKVAAEKYFTKKSDETVAEKEIREQLISDFVRKVLETNGIISKSS